MSTFYTAVARISVGVALSVVCIASDALGQSFQGIGTLPGYTYSGATGVSADGSVLVGYCAKDSGSVPIRWTPQGDLESLGSLGGQFGRAFSISADGSTIVGWSQEVLPSGPDKAFRWTATTGIQSLGTLGGSRSLAYCVSADGSVIGGAAYSSETRTGAFRWTAGAGMIDLGLSGNYSSAAGMSSDGSVLVGGGPFAYRWSAGSVEDLGLLNSQSASAVAVSADGSVITGINSVSTPQGHLDTQHVFRWTAATGMQDLGAIGTTIATATAMSPDGSTIVGTSGGRAFIWRPEHGMVNLAAYMQSFGIDSSGWVLWNAFAISADSATIVGYGAHNGVEEGWIAVLPALGTCCDTSGACTNVLPADCTASWSRGGTCAAQPCPIGACCQGTTCALSLLGICPASQFRGVGTVCGTAQNPLGCCTANFDGINGVAVADVFAYLNAWFAGTPGADIDGVGGLQVADIFAFLNLWFAGC
jgi:probable HAF family extracellular repeat protein